MRMTGNDKEGTDQLGNFIDPQAKYPVIVTTSRLLSTGIDAQTCRLIVIDREIGSMTLKRPVSLYPRKPTSRNTDPDHYKTPPLD